VSAKRKKSSQTSNLASSVVIQRFIPSNNATDSQNIGSRIPRALRGVRDGKEFASLFVEVAIHNMVNKLSSEAKISAAAV
jgi:hypothetical protein